MGHQEAQSARTGLSRFGVTAAARCKVARCKIEGIVRAIASAQEGERNNLLNWGAFRLAELVRQSVISPGDAASLASSGVRA